MNHRPFEDWLLDDEPLTAAQALELRVHLRSCAQCGSIAESNLALHSTRHLAPSAGFTDRFQARLEEHRRQQRWRQIAGTFVLVFGGLALLYPLLGPAIANALSSPSAWIAGAVGYCIFFLTAFRAVGEVARILLRDLPTFVSPAGWFMMLGVAGGLGGLWMALLRRFAHASQGVRS
jgi:hypothetical protein